MFSGWWCGHAVAIKRLLRADGAPMTRESVDAADFHLFNELCNEASIMASLRCANIVQLFGFARSPVPTLVMERCAGGDLDTFLRNRAPSSVAWPLRLAVALDVARGIAFMHAHSVLHRDLRSPNVFLVHTDDAERNAIVHAAAAAAAAAVAIASSGGSRGSDSGGGNDDANNALVVAKVADFGLSRRVATHATESLESWSWMAPETRGGTARSVAYDERADVYSFAMVCAHLLTHQVPFAEYADRESHAVASNIVRIDLRPTLDGSFNNSNNNNNNNNNNNSSSSSTTTTTTIIIIIAILVVIVTTTTTTTTTMTTTVAMTTTTIRHLLCCAWCATVGILSPPCDHQ